MRIRGETQGNSGKEGGRAEGNLTYYIVLVDKDMNGKESRGQRKQTKGIKAESR